jgi:hypothetical protein
MARLTDVAVHLSSDTEKSVIVSKFKFNTTRIYDMFSEQQLNEHPSLQGLEGQHLADLSNCELVYQASLKSSHNTINTTQLSDKDIKTENKKLCPIIAGGSCAAEALVNYLTENAVETLTNMVDSVIPSNLRNLINIQPTLQNIAKVGTKRVSEDKVSQTQSIVRYLEQSINDITSTLPLKAQPVAVALEGYFKMYTDENKYITHIVMEILPETVTRSDGVQTLPFGRSLSCCAVPIDVPPVAVC